MNTKHHPHTSNASICALLREGHLFRAIAVASAIIRTCGSVAGDIFANANSCFGGAVVIPLVTFNIHRRG